MYIYVCAGDMHMFSEYVNKHTCRETCKHLFYTCASRDTHMHRYMYIYMYICMGRHTLYACVCSGTRHTLVEIYAMYLCVDTRIYIYIFMNKYIHI